MSWGVSHLLALLTGFCLDLLLGDPHWAPHPVRAVGVLIAALEKLLRRLFPKSPGGELAGGAALVALMLNQFGDNGTHVSLMAAAILAVIAACISGLRITQPRSRA